ncbi:ABC transporter permease [uncultured Croceitalea sp.]|uniref:ABC transporter permease n=1 Tax=uncultured Croceitalea sp. TaxID=1798908 RepID=UPI0033063BEC
MNQLYFKIAVRYLLKNKLYSFLNITGLAVGIASFVLIMVYVNYEKSYDRFEGSDQVHRIYMDYLKGESFEPGDAMTYNASGPTLKNQFPEVLDYVRFYYFEKVTFALGDKIIEQPTGSMADDSYFNIFNYELINGNKSSALKEPNSIVLTESLKDKLFGSEDPINKPLEMIWDGDPVTLRVTGVMQDVPKNSHFRNNFLVSYSTENTWDVFPERHKKLNWNMNNFYTYLKVDKSANIASLRQKMMDADIEEDEEERHNIEALHDIHLLSDKPYEVTENGSATRIKFLTAIAFIILVLSWLNYINLSTTKAMERAKEIGVRKVSGAQRGQLIFQSLIETIVLNVLAVLIAFGLALLLLPIYNAFTGAEINLNIIDFMQLMPMIGIVLLGMVLAGLYPAIVLSNYSPTKALKGKIRASANGLNLRKGLIITQFLATIILVIGTIVVTKQIKHLQEQPAGVNLNQIVSIQGSVVSSKKDSLLHNDFLVLEQELAKLPFVEKVTNTKTFPGASFDNLSTSIGMSLPGGIEDDKVFYYSYYTQHDYFELLNIEFVVGKTFVDSPLNTSDNVVVNETFLKAFGVNDPSSVVNKKIKFWGHEWLVTGVIKDYHHFGLKKPILPMVIRHGESNDNILLKLDAKASSTAGFASAIKQIEKTWKRMFPSSTFDYTFLDSKFEAQYAQDKQFGTAFSVFTGLAVFIACLGLFGLTSYTCAQRRKEIGIRKVNGASVFKILALLNIDFVKWVGIAFVIAVPTGWYFMNNWLQNFPIKTTINWWVFFLAGITTLLVALLTVSWQSFTAANGNPVEVLRDE